MKIAMGHVDLPSEARGGVAYQVHYLANALTENGHDVTVFTFSPPDATCRYQVRQYALAARLRKLQSFALAFRLARTDFRGFDVIHAHGDNWLLRGRHPQLRTFYGSAQDEAQTAVSWKRRAMQTLMARLERIGAQVADLNVGISEATRKRLPDVREIVPCGVDLRAFYPGSKSEHPTILFVGTVGGRKRGAWLADLFRREIRPRFPDAELWSVADGPLEGEAEGVRNQGKVSLEVLADLYRRAWVFCLPSTYEGFGVPYIEAMASSTPVVASPNPGAREVLGEGEFGCLADDDTLAATLNRLLSNPEERADWAERGQARAEIYGWDRVVARYERIYHELMESQSARQ